jgi:conjugative transposon TraM protein
VQKTEDPELMQMSGLLEKILEIQHPERVREKIENTGTNVNKKFLAIPAIVDGKQKVTDGTVVRMKMLDSAYIGTQLIPKGQLVYATGNLYNQRLSLHVKNIRIGYTIFPVDLTVYDMTDGLEGISVPEAVTGNAVKDGAVSGLQGTEFMTLDPSMSAQLAGAGINAAKGLFSKKVKAAKGKIKDGHALLLRDNQLANSTTK